MNNETKNIMIVGVGGQGTLLASRIIGNAIMQLDYDVKVSEVHGMSQRGGAVVTYVRYGKEVFSPVVDKGEADFILSFEALESARWLDYLKKDGILITSTQEIEPMPVIIGAAEYPGDIIKKIKEKGVNTAAVDALSIAESAGSSKAVNVVLVGVLSQLMGFSDEVWEKAVEHCVPQKFYEINKKAFELGRQIKI